MLKWAVIFLIIAIIAGIFGFTGIAEASATIAQVLFGIFLFLSACLVASLTAFITPASAGDYYNGGGYYGPRYSSYYDDGYYRPRYVGYYGNGYDRPRYSGYSSSCCYRKVSYYQR